MSAMKMSYWYGQTIAEFRYGLWLFGGLSTKNAAIETIKNLRYF